MVKKCLISIFELSGHAFGTILKSNALVFQSASYPRLSSPVPLKIVLVERKNTKPVLFFNKKNGKAAPHRSPDLGCCNKLFLTNSKHRFFFAVTNEGLVNELWNNAKKESPRPLEQPQKAVTKHRAANPATSPTSRSRRSSAQPHECKLR